MPPTNRIFRTRLGELDEPAQREDPFDPRDRVHLGKLEAQGLAVDFEADLGDVADQSGHQERDEERKQHQDDRLEEIGGESAGRGDGAQAHRVEVSEYPAHERCALLEHLGSREMEHPQRGEQDEGRGNLAAVRDLAAACAPPIRRLPVPFSVRSCPEFSATGSFSLRHGLEQVDGVAGHPAQEIADVGAHVRKAQTQEDQPHGDV